ncbi:hypothetical protein [Streptomyces sp. NPDC005547]|uniref:hypothetical protein n=1 Tax=unclassified Streptomyces TaxID=2593676 RepID=UPI0033B8C9A5
MFWWYQFKNNGELAKRFTHSPDGEPGGADMGTTLYAASFSNDAELVQLSFTFTKARCGSAATSSAAAGTPTTTCPLRAT